MLTGGPEGILALQREIGNQAVVRMVVQRKVDVLPGPFFGRLLEQRRGAAMDQQTATKKARSYVYLRPVNEKDMRTFPEEVEHVRGFTDKDNKRELDRQWASVRQAAQPEPLSDGQLGTLQDQVQALANAVDTAETKISMRPAELRLELSSLLSKSSGTVDLDKVLSLIKAAPEFERAAVAADNKLIALALKHLRDEDVAPFSLALGARARGPHRNKLQATLRELILNASDGSLTYTGVISAAIQGAPDDIGDVRDDRFLIQNALLKMPAAQFAQFTDALAMTLGEVVEIIFKPALPFERVLAVVNAANDQQKGTVDPKLAGQMAQAISKDPQRDKEATKLKTDLRKARKNHPPAEKQKVNVEVKAADAEMRHVSPRMADQVITTALSPFVSGAIKRGKTLLGNTAILPQEAFETVAASLKKPEGLNAFQDKGRMYINAGRGDPGTVIHEGIHQYAEDLFLQTFGMFPNEGLTEYFARKAIAEVPEWDIKRSVYIDELALGRKMIAYLGDSVMARVVFDGKLSELQKAYVAKRSEQGRNGEEDWSQLLKAAKAETWDAFARLWE